MGKPGSIMISLRSQKDLGLVLHTPERFGMEDSVTVPLIDRPQIARLFFPVSPCTIAA